MSLIVREYYRAHYPIVLRFFTIAAVCVCVMLFTGTYSRENVGIPAVIVSVFLGLLAVWSALDVLTAPARFRILLKKMDEPERREIIDGFETAKPLGRRWFLKSHLVYFAKRRIKAVRYDDMLSADLRGNKLSLSLSGGKTVPFPFTADENPAVLVAVLRSRNENLSATIDGKPVEFGKGKEKATVAKEE